MTFTSNISDTQSIITAIKAHLDAHDLSYNFREDCSVFDFHLGVPDVVNTLQLAIIVHDDSFTVSASYPLGVNLTDDDTMTTMAKFLTRVNYGLRHGNFEMNLDSGRIRYKVHCSCADIQPSDAMIRESIHCPASMFHKYGPGIRGILFHNMTDDEAEDTCENNFEDELSHLETLRDHLKQMCDRLFSSDDDNDEVDESASEEHDDPETNAVMAFMKMLEARFHGADDDDDLAEVDENSDEDESA